MFTNKGLKYYASEPDDDEKDYKKGLADYEEDMKYMYGEDYLESQTDYITGR